MFATCPVSLMPIFKGILPLLSGPQATYFFNLNVYDVIFFLQYPWEGYHMLTVVSIKKK